MNGSRVLALQAGAALTANAAVSWLTEYPATTSHAVHASRRQSIDLPPMVEPVLMRELDSFLRSRASPA